MSYGADLRVDDYKADALRRMFVEIIDHNRAGGWRKLLP